MMQKKGKYSGKNLQGWIEVLIVRMPNFDWEIQLILFFKKPSYEK